MKLFSFCLMLVLLCGFFSDLWAVNQDSPSLPKLNWLMNGQLITKPTSALTPLGAGAGAISGRVTKASGSDPIPNVVVTARQIDCPHRSYAGTTGSDGYYIINDVP
jgi:hypothetical protein